jgi:hypothetical protein
MSNLLVVVDDVAQVVATRVVRLADAHRVVGQVDIAVVAEELRHGCGHSRVVMNVALCTRLFRDCFTALVVNVGMLASVWCRWSV